MKDSEFISADNLTLHLIEGKPSANIEGAKELKVKKGEKIPDVFVPLFLRNNRDFIANLKLADGIPVLSAEQEKKYQLHFTKAKPKTFKEEIDKSYGKYTMEDLKQKVAKLGSKGFKDWAEKEYGEDEIDRRQSADKIIVNILNEQAK